MKAFQATKIIPRPEEKHQRQETRRLPSIDQAPETVVLPLEVGQAVETAERLPEAAQAVETVELLREVDRVVETVGVLHTAEDVDQAAGTVALGKGKALVRHKTRTTPQRVILRMEPDYRVKRLKTVRNDREPTEAGRENALKGMGASEEE